MPVLRSAFLVAFALKCLRRLAVGSGTNMRIVIQWSLL